MALTACAGLTAAVATADITLLFSDFSSDETPPDVLTAEVTFSVDNQDERMVITINNTSRYSIAQLCFNTDNTLHGLELEDAPDGWSVEGGPDPQSQGAAGFGYFNWLIDFGNENRLPHGETVLFLEMDGTTEESTIGHKMSTGRDPNLNVLAALKFEQGPDDDSAFGGSVTVDDGCPEFILATSGDCPGVIECVVECATPGGRVAFLVADGPGDFMIPRGNPCAGTVLGLDRTVRVAHVEIADENGRASSVHHAPIGVCDNYFQAIDVATCRTSNVTTL